MFTYQREPRIESFLHITQTRKQMEQRIMGGFGEKKTKVNKTKPEHPSSSLRDFTADYPV